MQRIAMIHRITTITTCTFLCILLASCVTSVDTSLPYDRLPEITVATEVTLVASPSHPTAYLPFGSISAGEKVQVIGTDSDAAWLLVLYKDMLGWMPTFYSRTNVGLLKSAIVVDPAPGKCSKYLGAISAPDEPWVNKAGDAAFVIGSVYRSKTEAPFEEATLALEITGGGTVVDADYMYTPLTPSKVIVLFGFSVVGLQKESQLLFNLANSSSEALAFQAAFFTNDCPEALNQLNIGKLRVPAANEAVASARNEAIQSQQTPTATLTPVQKESGPSKPEPTATPTLNPTRAAMTANMQLIYQNDFEGVINAEWSKTQRDVSPSGEGFLGQFGNDVVTLRLTDLPEHNSIGLSFDLYIIRSWDGVNTSSGPDTWDLNVAGGPTLLHTSFSNGDPLKNARQAYPDPYPGGNQPARTGATENSSLGYNFRVAEYTDSTYQLTFDFAHSASTLELNFSASGLQKLDDESWGIDNVQVHIKN
jgi:uncharacterized protein YgiM (DUF1202 family)